MKLLCPLPELKGMSSNMTEQANYIVIVVGSDTDYNLITSTNIMDSCAFKLFFAVLWNHLKSLIDLKPKMWTEMVKHYLLIIPFPTKQQK